MKTLIYILLTIVSNSVFAEVNIESPSPDSIQQGVSDVHGWSSGSQQLRVLVDGRFATNLRADTLRADINPDTETGFSLAFNYGLLSDGVHEIQVVDALTGDSDSVSFRTIRLSDRFLQDSNVSPFQFRDVPVDIAGVPARVGFQWSTARQTFTIISVEKMNSLTRFQRESLSMVNRIRSEGVLCHGTWNPPVPALTWDSKMADAARKHARYLTGTNNISHTGRNGTNAGQRMQAEGLKLAGWAENIHQIDAPAEIVIQGYIDDVGIDPPGHCINIMNPDMTHFGTAIDGRFSVQDFAILN